jgi:hypothetical protein
MDLSTLTTDAGAIHAGTDNHDIIDTGETAFAIDPAAITMEQQAVN